MPFSHRPAVSNQGQVLRRSFSQKDLKPHDGYSVSSSLIDSFLYHFCIA